MQIVLVLLQTILHLMRFTKYGLDRLKYPYFLWSHKSYYSVVLFKSYGMKYSRQRAVIDPYTIRCSVVKNASCLVHMFVWVVVINVTKNLSKKVWISMIHVQSDKTMEEVSKMDSYREDFIRILGLDKPWNRTSKLYKDIHYSSLTDLNFTVAGMYFFTPYVLCWLEAKKMYLCLKY